MARHKQRRFRNYLLDKRFQLKYTAMVLLVTAVVAGVLGYAAYRYSKGQTQALAAQIALQPEMDPAVAQDLEGFAERADQRVALAIVLGVLALLAALAVTCIVLTHRLVGPAYRMTKLFEEVAEGRLQVRTGIRKSDEFQDLFQSFASMVESLRAQRSAEIAQLKTSLGKLESIGVEPAPVTELKELLGQLQQSLGSPSLPPKPASSKDLSVKDHRSAEAAT
jgi:HAMP domain-containing protein